MHRIRPIAGLALMTLAPFGSAALAHDGSGPLHFNLDPLVTVPLVLSAWAYLRGVRALWRHAGRGRGVSVLQATYC